jgi:probable rRNA maturation factor
MPAADTNPPDQPDEPDSPVGPQGKQPSVDVLIEDDRWLEGLDLALFRRCTMAAASVAGGDVVVALGDDATVADLNVRFRGKTGATNVLSFPNADPRMGLGDVILAFETMQQEAQAAQIPLDHHACHLAVHGILHLAGHDHDSDVAAARMEAAETEILARFAIPDPYAPEPDANDPTFEA